MQYVRAYAKASLFHNYHTMTRIWNHPDCLINAERDRKEKEEKELAKSSRKAKKKAKSEASQAKAKGKDRRSPSESKDGSASLFANRVSGGGEGDDGSSSSDGIMLLDGDREWWKEMLSERRGYTQGELSNSGKLVLTIDIVRECRRRGDKVLIFSQVRPVVCVCVCVCVCAYLVCVFCVHSVLGDSGMAGCVVA